MKTASLLLVSVGLALLSGCSKTETPAANDGPKMLAAGTVAPDFTALKVDGTPVKLSDYAGKMVLVDFWATWCGPCKVSMPHMESLHKKLESQGLVVLGVCVWDQKAAFEAWDKKPEVPTSYLKVYDPAGTTTSKSIAGNEYPTAGIPSFYLIGKDGKVAFAGMGSGGDTEKALEKALSSAGFKL